MNKNSFNGQEASHDEIFLAVSCLRKQGMTYRQFAEKFRISQKTVCNVLHGVPLKYKREELLQDLVRALDEIYQETHDPEIQDVFAEIFRLKSGLKPSK